MLNNLRVNGKVIEILWIPSYTGITGNEDVAGNRLACLADGIPCTLELTPNEIRSIIKKRIYRDWQNLWSTSSMVKGHNFFNVCPRIPIRPWFENFNLYRKQKVNIILLRLGHAIKPAYRHRIGRRDNPYCSCDSISIGDINHVLLGCERQKQN